MVYRGAREFDAEPGAASLAVWIAYAAWGVFCPQLIDFADAPVFGLFLACWVAVDHSRVRSDDLRLSGPVREKSESVQAAAGE